MATPTTSPQQAFAKARYVRITARKVRLVIDAIRGRTVKEAEDLLRFIPKGAATPVAKLLKSAKANAINNHDMLEDQLVVKSAFVDEGPRLKRILPRARGRGDYMVKGTSHITIILEEGVVKTTNRRRQRPQNNRAVSQPVSQAPSPAPTQPETQEGGNRGE